MPDKDNRPEYEILTAALCGCGFDSKNGTAWMVITWEAKGIGSGEITLVYNMIENSWQAETETMTRDFIRAVLMKIADSYSEEG